LFTLRREFFDLDINAGNRQLDMFRGIAACRFSRHALLSLMKLAFVVAQNVPVLLAHPTTYLFKVVSGILAL
jgi:hypothetical protein